MREAGRTAEARAVLERWVACAPSIEARLDLAEVLRETGDFAGALEHGRAVLAEAPGHPAALALTRELDGAIEVGTNRLDYLLRLLGPMLLEQRYPAPYVEFTGRPRGQHAEGNIANGHRLDDWGFPNAAVPSAIKPDDEIPIFVLGDSTMALGTEIPPTVPPLRDLALRDPRLPTPRLYNFTVVPTSPVHH